jgi:hypothetical protein
MATSKKTAKAAKQTGPRKAAVNRPVKKTASKAAPRKAASTPLTREPAKRASKKQSSPTAAGATKPKLLSGGNPQIAKADGDEPVQTYIAAMPGWQSKVGRQLDALIARTVPNVYKAVKWNSPLYGIEGDGWFLGIHCFNKYIKVAFFRGAALRPLPPDESKQQEVRYLNIHEGDKLDEKQFAAWVKQASNLPGEKM